MPLIQNTPLRKWPGNPQTGKNIKTYVCVYIYKYIFIYTWELKIDGIYKQWNNAHFKMGKIFEKTP